MTADACDVAGSEGKRALADLIESAKEMGADGVIGIDLDYEVLGAQGSMLMVSASGTAVKLG